MNATLPAPPPTGAAAASCVPDGSHEYFHAPSEAITFPAPEYENDAPDAPVAVTTRPSASYAYDCPPWVTGCPNASEEYPVVPPGPATCAKVPRAVYEYVLPALSDAS